MLNTLTLASKEDGLGGYIFFKQYLTVLLVFHSVSDLDPVGFGYFDRLGYGSGLKTQILDPDSQYK